MRTLLSTQLLLSMLLPSPAFAQDLAIDWIGFHDATDLREDYAEDYDNLDEGGVLFAFIRNTQATPAVLETPTLNGQDLNTWVGPEDFDAHRWWQLDTIPERTIPGGAVRVLKIKANGPPIAEGQPVTIGVRTAGSSPVTASATLTHPALRIGWVVASQDLRSLQIFVRNEDAVPCAVNGVYVGGDVTAQTTFVGGPTIAPGALGILKVDMGAPQPLMSFLAVRITATRQGGGTVEVGAPVRLLRPWFPVSTWSSSMCQPEEDRKFARAMLHDMAVTDVWKARDMYERWFIGSSDIKLWENPDNGGEKEPHVPTIAAHAGQDYVYLWMVRDEPDLFKKPSSRFVTHNAMIWGAEATKPTYINLASHSLAGEYGHIPDIAGVDHYAMFSAPNIIPGTWIPSPLGRGPAQMTESFEYPENLKRNVEPKATYNWPQISSGAWDTQPLRWGVNYQFWATMMAGSKGYFWFKYGPGYENEDDYEEATAEGLALTRQFAQIRNLLLYGDPLANVQRSTTDIKSRAIYGEQAVVAIVVNNNYSASFRLSGFQWEYDLDPVNYSITVTLPSWLPTGDPSFRVYRVGVDGSQTIPFSVNGQQVTIDDTVHEDSRVYVLGRADTSPPDAPRNLVLAEAADTESFVLSWMEPFDDFGVMGYHVFADGRQIAETREPVFDITGVGDPDAWYEVRAFDAAGNAGARGPGTRRGYWAFQNDGYAELWRPANHIANWRVVGGHLAFDVAGLDPFMELGVDPSVYPLTQLMDAGRYRYLRLRMRNGTPGNQARLFWTTAAGPVFSGDKSAAIAIEPNDSAMREYTLDLGAAPSWNGTIQRVRLDPVDNGNGTGSVAIDLIELRTTPPGDDEPTAARRYDVYD